MRSTEEMRYIQIHTLLSILIGLACATSCSSDQDSDVLNSENGEEIKVETAVGPTRATITTTSTLINQPFMLFGDVNRKGEFHSGPRVLFDKAVVTYEGSQWNYEVTQYWQMGQEHSFVALQPISASIPGMTELNYEKSAVSFRYTIPDEYRDLRDIIVATHRRKYNFENADPVKFNFQHLLTQIDIAPALSEDLMFEVLPNDDEKVHVDDNQMKFEFIQVREMKLSGFKKSADFIITPDSLNSNIKTDTPNIDIRAVDGSEAEISFEFNEEEAEPIVNSKTNISILGEDNTIFMIPQTLGDDAKIDLAYTVNTDTAEDPIIRRITIPLKDQTLKYGKHYRMCFTIENVYEGQIKDGSLKWEVTDIVDSEAGEDWIIDETGIIKHEFNPEEKPGSDNTEDNNDNQDEE